MGLGPMTSYDAIANPIMDWDKTPSNNAAFNAIPENPAIVTEKNPVIVMLPPGDKRIELAKQSEKMDFIHPDSAPAAELNRIIWKSIKGINSEMPPLKKGLSELATAKKSEGHKDVDD
jgi:hypothetical protein